MSNLSSTVTFQCPIPQCGQDVILSITHVTKHVHSCHSLVNEKMGRPKIIGYCKDCNSYTRFKHFHCFECDESKYFRHRRELIAHLKDQHAKWWLEFNCKYELGCYGLSGKCGFNHRITDKEYIDNDEPIPAGVCRDDRPWDDIRCVRQFCSFDHFRGRMKFLIAMKTRSMQQAAVAATIDNRLDDSDEYDEDFEEHEATDHPETKDGI
jgi:hypothetical protein